MPASPLASFAEAHGLAFTEAGSLPERGATLTQAGGKVEGSASGTLPGGIEGTLARFTYVHATTDSDGNTSEETRPFTLVVTEVPESIGFVPYLGFSGPACKLSESAGGTDMAPIEMQHVKALKGSRARAYKGVSERWLAQLLSPALVEWLGRCDDDFGFELASGVLVAGRSRYLEEQQLLADLCTDAAHLAGAIREESLEEVESGGEAEAAVDPHYADERMEAALARVGAGAPPDTSAAAPAFRADAARTAPAYLRGLRFGLLGTLLLNVPAAAIPILLISSGNYAVLAAFELGLISLIAFFVARSQIRADAVRFGVEAFYRGYASERGLAPEEPLRFLATHAEAKLAFKPDRVFVGPLPGGIEAALAVGGDGSKRSDRVAVVAGPRGPVAEAELQAESPGLSAKTLDAYAERLVAEVKEDIATRPG